MVSVLICQPFTVLAIVGIFACMALRPSTALRSSAVRIAGGSFSTSNGFPTSNPIRFIRATVDQSVSCGGLTAINCAAYLK